MYYNKILTEFWLVTNQLTRTLEQLDQPLMTLQSINVTIVKYLEWIKGPLVQTMNTLQFDLY